MYFTYRFKAVQEQFFSNNNKLEIILNVLEGSLSDQAVIKWGETWYDKMLISLDKDLSTKDNDKINSSITQYIYKNWEDINATIPEWVIKEANN